MKRALYTVVFLVANLTVGSTWAQSPHFITDTVAFRATDPEDLLVSFKEAGLGTML